ncbi:hypothetical protein PMO31116_03660 [Pandoraea morbifera]|uniref:Glycine transferase n=1 Tax=Pandoraea morbifera TaxID=2508300 RepID=A0A5E4X6K2_9BURK|nr:WbqC family protein [Pandoraea morbifera]VVE31964.1 hypothetical protein PMO31116_03660 [Pandoraea morbifera]
MKVGIMQPYFLPYIGYLQLMNLVDKWVIFDDIQFIDKGWVNRNRILHPDEEKEWQFITLPLSKRGQFDKISALRVDHTAKWREQILGKLTMYKKKAPFYKDAVAFVNQCFSATHDDLSAFLEHTLRTTARTFDMRCEFLTQSRAGFDTSQVETPGQWALEISKQLGADEYINPHGGVEIFDEAEYAANGVKLTFLKPTLTPYKQRREGFVPGLSIVDVMMWNSIDDIKAMLENDFSLKTKAELVEAGEK